MELAQISSGKATRRWGLWGLSGLVIVLAVAAWWIDARLTDPTRASKPFRIGFQQAPPYQVIAADGSPAGPGIEIIAEAARRRHIPLQWVAAPEGPEPNLTSGKVDLWPLVGDLPERRKLFYISDSWTNITYWMISLESSGISTPEETAGHNLWYVDLNIFTRLARANFPSAHLTRQPTIHSVLEGVCTGKADAGLISGSKADAAYLLGSKSSCQNAKLRFYMLTNGNLGFGVGASFKRRGADKAADALRAGIGDMAKDGTLSAIYYRTFQDPSNEALTIYYLSQSQRRNLYLSAVIWMLAVLFVLLGWQTMRASRARHSADAAKAALEEQVAVRTAELTQANEQLRQEIIERKRAEETLRQAAKMEAIGRLAGGIAHDFNNLLTIITGYSQLLRDALAHDPPLKEKVEAIREAGDRASTLTRQLLTFSRHQVTQPKILNLNDILFEMASMLQRLVREDIELTIWTDPTLGSIRADMGQIEQVIMNLVINARDAMPQGGKLLVETSNVTVNEESAKLSPGAKPGAYVRLTVSDTGSGMDEETQAHIFEPFFTTKGHGKGTGLGLAMVYGIAEQAGGYIAVQSQVGQGTTFHLYLPRSEAVETQSSHEVVMVASKAEHGCETVLVVEDQEAVRTLVCEILRKHGYTVLPARDGREALTLSEQIDGRIDLIVTDVVMPQMGGQELAKVFSSMHPETKVLYMSGYVDKEATQKEMAGLAFINKPFTPAALAQKVRELLQKGHEG